MNIDYDVIIRDNMEGYELVYDSFDDVNEAIETHKKFEKDIEFLRGVLLSDFFDLSVSIDQYHWDHPHKRYDITIEVAYD